MKLNVTLGLILTVAMALQAPAALAAVEGAYAEDVDRSADACTNFYDFANGAWRAQNPIPASMGRWSRRWASGEFAKDQLKVILEEASAKTSSAAGSTEQLIGDHYAACMDVGRIDSLGIKPIAPLLAEIDALRDMAGVQGMLGRFHDMNVPAAFSLVSGSDNHEPTQVIAQLNAGGLGLPDRDYYLKPEPRFEEAREKYLEHIASMFKLTGSADKDAKNAAQSVFDQEKALAAASLDNVA